jgi:3-hydroxyacyl-CoA dehydrogenase
MTFGGGCEMSLHADKVVAAAETYMGLVEFGVGVIPGGGGSKNWRCVHLIYSVKMMWN